MDVSVCECVCARCLAVCIRMILAAAEQQPPFQVPCVPLSISPTRPALHGTVTRQFWILPLHPLSTLPSPASHLAPRIFTPHLGALHHLVVAGPLLAFDSILVHTNATKGRDALFIRTVSSPRLASPPISDPAQPQARTWNPSTTALDSTGHRKSNGNLHSLIVRVPRSLD